jgi:hypothetical protein
MLKAISRRVAALEAAQKPTAPAWSLLVSVVEVDDAGEALRVVRVVPAKRAAPLNLPALVAELWGGE